jgi:hypothetical protein
MATAVKQITATSKDGGHPCHQSRHMAVCHAFLARLQSESVLGGSNGNGGIQSRTDNGGARLLAGEWLMAATAELFQSLTAMDSNLCDFRIRSIVFGLFSLSNNH